MACQLLPNNRITSQVQHQQLRTTLIPISCPDQSTDDGIIKDSMQQHSVGPSSLPPRQPLSRYIQWDSTEEEIVPYLLTRSQLQQRWSTYLSIVTPEDDITYCFTAGYSRILHKSTGSVLLVNTPTTTTACSIDKANLTQYLGKIRRFTPKEISNLLGFPTSFQFPTDDVPLAQQYKLIGNSIQVTLVAKLLETLFLPSLDSESNEVIS
jgi:site-specific DNA-cytosine methylase